MRRHLSSLYDIFVAELGGRELRVRRTVERRPVAPDEAARFVDDFVARYPKERQPDVRARFQQGPHCRRRARQPGRRVREGVSSGQAVRNAV